MTVAFTLILSALHLEDDDLVTLYEWVNNFAYYLCALYCRSAYLYCTLVVYEKYLVKLYCLTLFRVLDVVNEQLLALLNLELLTVNFYDCVHFYYLKRVCSARRITSCYDLFEPIRTKIGCKVNYFYPYMWFFGYVNLAVLIIINVMFDFLSIYLLFSTQSLVCTILAMLVVCRWLE